MKILLINHYAGSPEMGMEFRPYYMAQEWIRQGHEVDIIAADYSHLRRKNPKVQRDWHSPSYLAGAGWDWMPYVPGRLAGMGSVITGFGPETMTEMECGVR